MTVAHRGINRMVRTAMLAHPSHTDARRPICSCESSKVLRYGPARYVTGDSKILPEVAGHTKHICCGCRHCYATWLRGSVKETAEKYAGIYDDARLTEEGPRAAYEESLFRYVLKHLDAPRDATLLDFGCGPNRSPVLNLREEGIDARGCDILPVYDYDGEIFFQHTGDATPWLQKFDGIVSIDVIEHLADTIDSWTFFNRVLKPGGMMAHCFPSQLHYSFMHAYFQTPFRVCLFSRKSMQILLEKTGFILEDVEPFDADVPYVFRFRKVREIDG